MNSVKANAVVPLPVIKNAAALRSLPGYKKKSFQKLALSAIDEVRFIAYDDIVYCRAVNNYTSIHTRSGKTVLCCKTLKEIKSKLPAENFIRIHQSYLINLADITAIKKQSGEIEINDKLLLPVARRKKSEIYTRLGMQ
jgi:two-component system, LytTR family, response regulator